MKHFSSSSIMSVIQNKVLTKLEITTIIKVRARDSVVLSLPVSLIIHLNCEVDFSPDVSEVV